MISREKVSDIYLTYNREVFGYLVRLCHDPDVAEDLLQESFERFIDYAQSHDVDEMTVRAFLYKTAHNLYVNYCVRRSKHTVTDIDAQAELIGRSDRTLEELSARELEERIERYMEYVSPEDRSIFMMHKDMGKTYDEIAGLTGMSSRTVRRRIRAVVDQLIHILEKEGFIRNVFG